MADFACIMRKTTTSTTVGVGSIECPASNPRRFRLWYIGWGSEGTSADNALLLQLKKTSTANTGTSFTPNPMDEGDPIAAVTLCKSNLTAEGTAVSNSDMLDLPWNQKATGQWYAVPEHGFTMAATASRGLVFATPTAAGTPAVSITAHITEL